MLIIGLVKLVFGDEVGAILVFVGTVFGESKLPLVPAPDSGPTHHTLEKKSS